MEYVLVCTSGATGTVLAESDRKAFENAERVVEQEQRRLATFVRGTLYRRMTKVGDEVIFERVTDEVGAGFSSQGIISDLESHELESSDD